MNKLYALILLLCISCSNRQKEVAVSIENETDSIQSEVLGQASEPFFRIDLFKEMKKAQKGQLKLSDFFQSIEYVPLETTDKSLIGGGKRLKGFTVSSKVIIDDMKLFDRKDGHFIGNVMNQGQGPQEYLFMFSIAVDDEREECYVYDSGKGVIHIVGYDTMYKRAYLVKVM
ncbi:MAG: 6-bladed beta-propeller [Parabacteroides sp.]|nr:6-bladed beta-propeller [Parabacteroides sp.]